MAEIREKGMYFAKNDLYEIVRNVGGQWNDRKFRPIVTLIQSSDNPDIYWAIPMGDYNHRDSAAKDRMEKYLNMPTEKIGSCFYHIGRTNKRSIFFVSKVIPVTEKYIEREFLVGPIKNNQQLVIKNRGLIEELERKVKRIVAYEKDYVKAKGNPRFEQNLLAVHSYLEQELINESIQAVPMETAISEPEKLDQELIKENSQAVPEETVIIEPKKTEQNINMEPTI